MGRRHDRIELKIPRQVTGTKRFEQLILGLIAVDSTLVASTHTSTTVCERDCDPDHTGGDSVWDLLAAQRAGALGIGLLSGGDGREELERSGAYRVYVDPAEMLTRLEEVGVRPSR